MGSSGSKVNLDDPREFRLQCRKGKHTSHSSGKAPGYMQANLVILPREGELVDEPTEITGLWRNDFITFLIGCSFTFDSILQREGLDVRHVSEGKNVAMYKTIIPCQRSGPFGGSLVVSMRPFSPLDAIKASEISSRYPNFHGSPVHIGDPNKIGIQDLDQPDFGDSITVGEDEVPVFWACGVSPQLAVMDAKLDIAIAHSPGHMLICDKKDAEI
mmetsp:Transcript_27823/g.36486  ORF Transcript_27823/g.36486 Transcript_27823/m.36486 type:complete len:215 (+) Transcript_27823:96-740(+)